MHDVVKKYLEPSKDNLILIYVLFLLGLLSFLLPIVGAVLAFVNTTNKDPMLKSHYIFAFRTFCFGVVGLFVALITTFIYIGPIIYILVFVWFILRSILAIQYLLEGAPHPNPLILWIK